MGTYIFKNGKMTRNNGQRRDKRYYVAHDGLSVLKFLGLSDDFSSKEKELFKERWDEFYDGRTNGYYKGKNGKNLVGKYRIFLGTIWTLYSKIIPFQVFGGGNKINRLSTERAIKFEKALIRTDLDIKLFNFESLEDVLCSPSLS